MASQEHETPGESSRIGLRGKETSQASDSHEDFPELPALPLEQADRARRAGLDRLHRPQRTDADGGGLRSARSGFDVSPDDGLVVDGVLNQPSSLAG